MFLLLGDIQKVLKSHILQAKGHFVSLFPHFSWFSVCDDGCILEPKKKTKMPKKWPQGFLGFHQPWSQRMNEQLNHATDVADTSVAEEQSSKLIRPGLFPGCISDIMNDRMSHHPSSERDCQHRAARNQLYSKLHF